MSDPAELISAPWRLDQPAALASVEDGPSEGAAVFLGPSLGTDLSLFDQQIPELARRYRIIRHDLRGHGASPTSPERFTLADLAADVVALADSLGIERFSYVGVSISGGIGLALAIDYPERLDKLVIMGCAAKWPASESWYERAARVRRSGAGLMVDSRPGIWFSERYAEESAHARQILAVLGSTDAESYAQCCEAIAMFDVRAKLGRITTPTLVIAGEHDSASPVALQREIAAGIPESILAIIPCAWHLPSLEHHGEFTELITRFLG